eukprot:3534261-Prymnesium_polylepis.1
MPMAEAPQARSCTTQLLCCAFVRHRSTSEEIVCKRRAPLQTVRRCALGNPALVTRTNLVIGKQCQRLLSPGRRMRSSEWIRGVRSRRKQLTRADSEKFRYCGLLVEHDDADKRQGRHDHSAPNRIRDGHFKCPERKVECGERRHLCDMVIP